MNVSFALKLSRQQHPEDWADLRDRTTCHAGAGFPASSGAVAVRLISEGIIPATGGAVESFADFVQESCIPGTSFLSLDP